MNCDLHMHSLFSDGTYTPAEIVAEAKEIGIKAAEAAKAKNISLVVVDRGGFPFHGRVKEIVDSAVAAGIKISTKPAKEDK